MAEEPIAEEPRRHGTHVDPDEPSASGREPGPGAPRWVKVGLIVAGVFALLLIIGMLVVGGQHGPGQHLPDKGGPTGEHGGHR